MNALQWVGVVAAIWVAAAVMVAVFWHRAKKAQPRIVRKADSCTCDYGPDWPQGVYCDPHGWGA